MAKDPNRALCRCWACHELYDAYSEHVCPVRGKVPPVLVGRRK